MTQARINKIDARHFNQRAMRMWEESDQGATLALLDRLPDDATDEDVEELLDGLYDEFFGDPEDDPVDDQIPRHAMENLERRYVVLCKIRGRYLPDRTTDSLETAQEDAEHMWKVLDDELMQIGGGVATITIFDRDEDRDLYHNELIRYPRKVVD